MKQRWGFARSIIHENLSEEQHRRGHRDKRDQQQDHHHDGKRGRILYVGFFLSLHRADKHDPDENEGHGGNNNWNEK